MTRDEAIRLVINAADQWASEYGFAVPQEASRVLAAIEVLEKESTMQGII